jgi:hypothetical protein
VRESAEKLRHGRCETVRELAKAIGLLGACRPVIEEAHLHLADAQRWKTALLREAVGNSAFEVAAAGTGGRMVRETPSRTVYFSLRGTGAHAAHDHRRMGEGLGSLMGKGEEGRGKGAGSTPSTGTRRPRTGRRRGCGDPCRCEASTGGAGVGGPGG